MFMINAGEIDLQPDFKRKPAVVSRVQRNIRGNAKVRIELKLSLVRDKLQRAAKTGRVAEAEEMFGVAPFLPAPPSSFNWANWMSTFPSEVVPWPSRPPTVVAVMVVSIMAASPICAPTRGKRTSTRLRSKYYHVYVPVSMKRDVDVLMATFQVSASHTRPPQLHEHQHAIGRPRRSKT